MSRLREAIAVTAGLTSVTLTVFHQQVADLLAVPDRGDPLFSIWRMAWVRHQIVTDPRHLFDANIFFPLPAALTYSDSMLLPAVASAPLANLELIGRPLLDRYEIAWPRPTSSGRACTRVPSKPHASWTWT